MTNKINTCRHFLAAFLVLFAVSFCNIVRGEENTTNEPAQTQENKSEGSHNAEAGGHKGHEEGFNAGATIMEHIGDSHQWHLWGDHGNAVHIPLPVILYTDKGLEIFSSSHVEHHEDIYQGKYYSYALHDEHIEIVDDNGVVNEEATKKITDLSITKNVAAIFISFALLCIIFLTAAKSYTKRKNQAPKGIQAVVEPFIVFIRDEIAKPNIGANYEAFMPFLLTLFFFIWINNMLGIIPFFPGGANVTGNIAVALTLALFTFLITTFSSNIHYWTHIVNTPGVPWWLKFPVPLMPIVELMGVLSKPIVLTLRLFANITAGHIIILSFVCLIFIFGKGGEAMGTGLGVSVASVLFSVFMDIMELLVAFLQAYVFTLLSAIYFGGAKVEHHHEEHH